MHLNGFRKLVLSSIVVSTLISGVVLAAPKKLEVNVKESKLTWIGKKIGGQHNGIINIQSGYVQLDGKKISGGEVVVDMKTLKNLDLTDPEYLKKLTDHLNSDDFFATEKNPTAVLKFKSSKETGKDKLEVTADLTIKGKTNKVTFPAELMWHGDLLHVKGSMVVDRTNYDIKYKSAKFFSDLGDKVINDEFEVGFEIMTQAAKAEEPAKAKKEKK